MQDLDVTRISLSTSVGGKSSYYCIRVKKNSVRKGDPWYFGQNVGDTLIFSRCGSPEFRLTSIPIYRPLPSD
jgi:hypothetical protein